MNTPAMGRLITVMMMAAGRAVRTSLWLKRRMQRRQRSAQSAQHLRQHMIRSDAQKPVTHLHRHMTVAEVVRGARERRGVGALHMQYVLGLRDNFDNAPIGAQEFVTATQYVAAGQQQPGVFAISEPGAQAAFLPQVEGQF